MICKPCRDGGRLAAETATLSNALAQRDVLILASLEHLKCPAVIAKTKTWCDCQHLTPYQTMPKESTR